MKIEDIKRWHVEERGWSDIGYHYVIELDGTIKAGRPISVVGAHCRGENNKSIGICYVGGCDKNMKPKDTRTKEQKKSLDALIYGLSVVLPIDVSVHGHNEFNLGKACPSFDVSKEYCY